MSFKRGHRIHLAGAGAIGLSHYGRAGIAAPVTTAAQPHESPVNTGANAPVVGEVEAVRRRPSLRRATNDVPPALRGGAPAGPVHPEFRCGLRHSGVVVAPVAGALVTFR